jgi:hypothetical protein
MPRFKKFVVTAVAAVGMALVVVSAARAEDLKPPKAAGPKIPLVYAVEQPPAVGARVESVMMDPRRATTGTKEGTGWLLHYGTRRDNCARADATFGLRMMCVAW